MNQWIINEIFLFSSIFIIGIYHLGLYFVRKKEISPLHFALFCGVVASRVLIDGELLLLKIFPYMSWELFMKVRYVSFSLVILTFCLFIESLYSQAFKKLVRKIVIVTCSIYSLAIIVTNADIYTYYVQFYQFIAVAYFLYVVTVLIRVIDRRQSSGVVFLCGLVAMFMTLINDVLFANEIIHWGTLTPFGVFLFILSLDAKGNIIF